MCRNTTLYLASSATSRAMHQLILWVAPILEVRVIRVYGDNVWDPARNGLQLPQCLDYGQ